MKRVFAFLFVLVTASFSCATPLLAEQDRQTSINLAIELADSADHEASALEFRRAALATATAEEKASLFWAAAHQYFEAGRHDMVSDMLDHAEDASGSIVTKALVLRGDSARGAGEFDEALFYFQSIMNSKNHDHLEFVTRRSAALQLKLQRPEEARVLLETLGEESTREQAALDHYLDGADKSPKIGGWLGLVPGLGYAYAGEYANALRSLILNGIFLYGAIDTAREDQWGLFTVISFFEVTWYTGSIYGGIDASHRYNRRRMENTVDQIIGDEELLPDYDVLPIAAFRKAF